MMTFRRKYEEKVFRALSFLFTAIIIFVLVQIIWTIAKKGIPALSWQIVSQEPKGGFYFGKEGGILNAIAGSFYLAVSATIVAFVISLPVALFLNIYLIKYQRLLIGIRFFLDVLWGIPSIVYGAFGFLILMYLGYRNSLGAGIVTVAALISPIMIRAMDEVLKTIPIGLQEAAYAIGSTKTETAFKVFFRQALPGLATAILLAFGRGIGDAASVFYTAAIILTFIVLCTSITARLLYRKK